MVPQRAVQPCDELEHVTSRILEAFRAGDVDALGNLFSDDPCLVVIGTDENERSEGYANFLRVARHQLEETGGFPFGDAVVHAFRDGDVGWAVGTVLVAVEGRTRTCRVTCVFRLSFAQWRCVQLHISFGLSNLEVLGIELTTSLGSLSKFAEENQPDLAGSAASDGTVTIVFTDIEASTEMAERLGDRRWLELLHWHEEIIASEAGRCDGTIVKSQGDGFMLAFSAASHALDFAMAVQRRTGRGYEGQPVRVRIGLNTGDAIRDRDDFFGRAVIVAARVAAHALGGQVLATDLVAGLVAGVDRFEFGDAQSTELKGLSGPYILRPLLVGS